MGDGGAEKSKGHARQPEDSPWQEDAATPDGRSIERGVGVIMFQSLGHWVEVWPGSQSQDPRGRSWNHRGDTAAAEVAEMPWILPFSHSLVSI